MIAALSYEARKTITYNVWKYVTLHTTHALHTRIFLNFLKPQVPTFNEPRVKQPSNKQLNISIIGIFRAATLGTVMARTFALADADRTTASETFTTEKRWYDKRLPMRKSEP